MTINKPSPIRELALLVAEMEFVENLVVEETTQASKQTDNEQARAVFSKWARESRTHGQTLKRVSDELRERNPEPVTRGLGMIDLRDIANMHLSVEGDAEKRYRQMAELADDPKLKKVFTKLAEAEKTHHHEAELLIEVVNKMLEEDAKKK